MYNALWKVMVIQIIHSYTCFILLILLICTFSTMHAMLEIFLTQKTGFSRQMSGVHFGLLYIKYSEPNNVALVTAKIV